MGINLLLGQGASPVRSLYLDGYGALFVTTVHFPLLPAPKAEQEVTEETRSDAQSTWEQTRRELYGNPPSLDPEVGLAWGPEELEDRAFDGVRVEQLQQNLLEALKNASNIRQLANDDSVTVCVIGSPAVADRIRGVAREPDSAKPGDNRPDYEPFLRNLRGLERRSQAVDRERTVMTIQARKADIDEFARGDISKAEFGSRTRSARYIGGGGWPAPMAVFWSQR
jgi:hypothetical protein